MQPIEQQPYIDPNIELLEALGNLQDDSPEDFKIMYENHQFSKGPASPYANFFVRFFRWLFCLETPSAHNDLRRIKKFCKHIVTHIKHDEELETRYQPLLAQAFEGLKNLYNFYRTDNSVEGMLKRNDILEGLAIGYKNQQALGITLERIKAIPSISEQPTFESNDIPTIKFADMEKATELLQQSAGLEGMTLADMQQLLGDILKKEQVPMGQFIDAMYKHEILNLNAVKSATTWYVAGRNLSESNVSGKTIVKFFQTLNIPVEWEWDGEIYAYSEVFSNELRKEKSNNTAFKRMPNKFLRDKFLEKARIKQQELEEFCGASHVIVSNSFCRLRVHQIKRGNCSPQQGVRQRFNIIGKLMNGSHENFEAAKHEISYTGEFAFSIMNMLGNEDEVELFKELVPIEKLTVDHANKLLLDGLTQMIDREDVTMVVQRLAPEDIHHFVLPVEGGEILSKEESCRALKEVFQDESVEHAQLLELENWFAENLSQDDKAGATINIAGTQSSVNPKALDKHSEILAQNDRKIMLVRHADGSLSVHAYIGATAVNDVDVTIEANQELMPMGEPVGSMGFGNQDKTGWQQPHKYESIEIRQSASPGRKMKLGKVLGNFDPRGSTVVSLYFNKDMTVTPELDAFAHFARHISQELTLWERICNCFRQLFGMELIQPLTVSRSIELQTSIGDVIGLTKTYMLLKAVRDIIPDGCLQDTIDQFYENFADNHSQFSNLPESTYIPLQDRIACEIWEALDKQHQSLQLSSEEEYLLQKLNAALAGNM